MNRLSLRYGSVCSGIEAVSLAWQPLGWHPAWFSEIDPFPNAVLAHHYPDVPNLGDMTLIAERVRAGEALAPDLLVGGTPCQAFSVAGARRGLSDPRGALTLKFTELADAIDQTRQHKDQEPSIVVWENVPGVLSDKSNAFGCLLGALAGESRALEPSGPRWSNAGCVLGPHRSVAWRVVDAQHFGVAQRRRRVFLVASGRAGFDPAEVLFEPYRLHRDTAPGEQAGQIAAGTAGESAHRAIGNCGGVNRHYGKVAVTACFGEGNTSGPIDRAACLTARGHKCDFEVETFAAQSVTGQITHTLNTANGGKGCGEDGSGRGVPILTHRVDATSHPLAFAQNSRGEIRLESGHGRVAGTLSTGGGKPGSGMPAIACPFKANPKHEIAMANGSGSADDAHRFAMIAFSAKDHGADAREGLSPTLRAGGHAGSHANAGVMPAIAFNADLAIQCRPNGELLGTKPLARSVALRGRDGGTAIELGDEVATALRASGGGSDKAHVCALVTEEWFEGRLPGTAEGDWSDWSGWRVRRLMPVECERLQGMPDNYTLVPYRGKPAADAPRYKAIGNSMAVPCVAWLGGRISNALRTRPRRSSSRARKLTLYRYR